MKMKVFHGLVNYGTQAGFFAQELRNRGIDALSVSSPDTFSRQVDVELLHGGNFIEKIYKHSWNWLRRVAWFIKYNTFHFYFGTTLFPNQIDLPLYKYFGKKVVMEYLGYDVQLFQYSLEKYEVTNVGKFDTKGEIKQFDARRLKRMAHESKFINKQIVCAPYLSEFVPGAEVLPLAINLEEFPYVPKSAPEGAIKIAHAPTSRNNKGTNYIVDAVERLKSEGFDAQLLVLENITHDALKKKYCECDIFIDQVLGGWYGTASIEAMAIGRPTICFIRESYFEYIDYGNQIPIISAQPSTLYAVLKDTIENRHFFPEIGRKSREFVENIHDVKKLTSKLIEMYKNIK